MLDGLPFELLLFGICVNRAGVGKVEQGRPPMVQEGLNLQGVLVPIPDRHERVARPEVDSID
jgi:hypothetical protein